MFLFSIDKNYITACQAAKFLYHPSNPTPETDWEFRSRARARRRRWRNSPAPFAPVLWIGHRKVRLAGHPQASLPGATVDGLPVYTFAVRGNTILTALDNERIQIDVARLAWQSDFRGLASSQGRCERAR